ncbi:MAG: hypothetical protein U0N22_03080 [Acutalibacter sp.]
MRRLNEPQNPFLAASERQQQRDIRRQMERAFQWLVKRPRAVRYLVLLIIPLSGIVTGVVSCQVDDLSLQVMDWLLFLFVVANVINLVVLTLQEKRDMKQRKRFLRRFVTVSFIVLCLLEFAILFFRGVAK